MKLNLKTIKQYVPALLILVVSLFPLVAFGQGEVDRGLSWIRGPFAGFTALGNARTLGDLINAIIRLLLTVAGALAVLFIIIGGFRYITAQGNEDQAESGKKTLLNAIIGLGLIILSWVIINVIVGTLNRGF